MLMGIIINSVINGFVFVNSCSILKRMRLMILIELVNLWITIFRSHWVPIHRDAIVTDGGSIQEAPQMVRT